MYSRFLAVKGVYSTPFRLGSNMVPLHRDVLYAVLRTYALSSDTTMKEGANGIEYYTSSGTASQAVASLLPSLPCDLTAS